MPVAVQEIADTRGGSDTALKRQYDIFGTVDEVEALTEVIAAAPSSLGTLPYAGTTLKEVNQADPSGGHYRATVNYGAAAAEEGGFEYRFRFQAKGAHVYQSLATVGGYVASGNVPDFYGAINVVDDGKLRVEGMQIEPPSETFTLVYHPAGTSLTTAYFNAVEDLVGKVNDTSFQGRAAGSLMLVRATGGAVNGTLSTIEFGFGYVQNQTNIPVGDITVASKDGLDLLWPFYTHFADNDAKRLVKKPSAAYVERVWYRGNFSALGI